MRTSPCWSASRRSAASGGTTPIRAAPATSRRTCTRCPSRPTRTGPRPSPRSRRSATTCAAVAREHGLLPHIRFGCSLLEAAWDDAAQRWRIETSAGPLTAGVLIDASGPIADPSIPELPGLRHLRRRGVPLGPLGPRRRPGRPQRRGRRHRRLGDPVRARDPAAGRADARSCSARLRGSSRGSTATTTRVRAAALRGRAVAAAAGARRQYLLRDLVLWKIMVSPRVRRIADRARPAPPAQAGGRPGAARAADARTSSWAASAS